ncbi:hypothetical protein ACHAXT_013298 [Thalassiosira profunda]
MAVLYHSDSSGRVGEVEDRLKGELDQLVIDIWRIGDPEKPEVLFGELFDDDEVQNYYEALVGTLKAAKKRGIVKYKSPMLLKGAHDKVMVNLVDETPLPASAFVTKPKVESAPPKPAPPKPSPAPKPPQATPVAPPSPKPAAAPAKPAAKQEPVDDLGDELMAFVKTKKAAPKEDATTSDDKGASTDAAPVEVTTKAAEPEKPPQSVPATKPAEMESERDAGDLPAKDSKDDTTAADATSGVAALDIKDTTKPEEPAAVPSAITDAGANGTKSATSVSSGDDAAPSNGKATKKKTKKIGSPRDLTSMLSPSMKKKFSFRKQNSSSEK